MLRPENALTFTMKFIKNICWAGIAQLVEYKLPKLGVAGSNPVARSSPGGCKTTGSPASPIEGAGSWDQGRKGRPASAGGEMARTLGTPRD